MSSSSKLDIYWSRPLTCRCLQGDVKCGAENIPADTVGTLMLSHLVTRCRVTRFLTAMTCDDTPRSYRIGPWTGNAGQVLIWRYFISHGPDVHLASVPRTDKDYLRSTSTFHVRCHSFLLSSLTQEPPLDSYLTLFLDE